MLVMAARYVRDDESMTYYRRFVLGAVVWVLVVTAGATLVWTVISDAGAGVAGELPTTTVPSTGTSTGGQPASDRPTPTATGTGPATPATSASGQPEQPEQPEQPADPVRRSWQGAAGVVVAECRDGAIALGSARPNSGWSIEVDHTGPDDLRVEFENGDARVRVEASCVGGTPSFVVDSD
jgi:hypothetical protein